MFDPGGCIDRLRACSFLGGGVRCFERRVSFGRRMEPEAGAFSGRRITWNIIFREKYKRFVMPYVLLQLIVVSPKLG